MPSLIKSLALKWDIVAGRYRAFFATKQEDIDACIRILEEVRRNELNRVSNNSVVESNAFANEQVAYDLIACLDTQTDQIIGCMRLTKARDIYPILSSRKEYHLDLFDKNLIDKISVFTRLAVLKAYRNSPAALVIMCFTFVHVLEEGGQAVLMSCEPNLFSMYKRLGLRPIGPLHNSDSGGYRIPMIVMPDLDNFKRVRSPALPLLKKVKWSAYSDIVGWYFDLMAKNGDLDIGASNYEADDSIQDDHWSITQGLSDKGLKSFMKNAMFIKCKEGDLLIAEKDGGKFLGIIQEGFAKVEIEGKTVAILSRGEIFGEIAFVLDQNRSADVIAGDSSTEIILFSVSLLKRMEKETDRTVFWRNLARILAQKVISTNAFVNRLPKHT